MSRLIEVLLMRVVLPLYLAGVLIVWFLSTDYLGEVPARFADEIGAAEIRDEIRSRFHREYVFTAPRVLN